MSGLRFQAPEIRLRRSTVCRNACGGAVAAAGHWQRVLDLMVRLERGLKRSKDR